MVVRRGRHAGRARRVSAVAAMVLASCSTLVLLGLVALSPGAAASSPSIPPRPTWVWPTPPGPPTPSHPPKPTSPLPSIPENPGPPSASPSLSPRPSPSLASPSRPPVAGIDRPAGYTPNPAASAAGVPKPDREPPARATANSHPNQDRLPASSLYASRSVAQSLIVGGLVGFTIAAIAMALLGWVRRRL